MLFPVILVAALFCCPAQAGFLDGIFSTTSSEESQDKASQNSKAEDQKEEENEDVVLVSDDQKGKSQLEQDLSHDRFQLLAFAIASEADNVDFSKTADLSDENA